MSGLLAARVTQDGVVHCGRETCSGVLGKVKGWYLVLTLGMVELRDAQGKPCTPPCYAMPHNVLWRAGAVARTGKRIAPFRGRLRAALPEATGERFADLSRGKQVWIKCPKCRDKTVVGPAV